MSERLSPDRALRFEAATHLRRTENIKDALDWIRENPGGFALRVKEFDSNITSLNRVLSSELIDQESFGNVQKLQAYLEESNQLPKFEEMVGGEESEKERGIDYETIEQTYREIDRLIKKREWQFPTA